MSAKGPKSQGSLMHIFEHLWGSCITKNAIQLRRDTVHSVGLPLKKKLSRH